MDELILRPGNKDDLNFIFATWIRSFKYSNLYTNSINSQDYFKYYAIFIQDILDRSKTEVTIATTNEDPSVIFGWSVTEPDNVLHYVYVKNAFRKMKIAEKLLNFSLKSKPIVCTHLTNDGWNIVKAKSSIISYNPYYRKVNKQ